MNNLEFNYINYTIRLLIVGIFIPGFTIIIILSFQNLIAISGIECPSSWKIIWAISGCLSIILPFIFIKLFKGKSLKWIRTRIILFNLIEYILIQTALASFFTKSETLCYTTDGQNGLEFVFTGWLSLPILLMISIIFQKKFND